MKVYHKLIKKLTNKEGTTLAETLCAFIIVVLAVTMMCGAIIQSASIVRTSIKEQKQSEGVIEAYWNGAAVDLGKTNEITMTFAESGGIAAFKIKKVKINAYNCKYNEGQADEYSTYIYDFTRADI